MKHRRPRPLATPFARAVAAVGLAALPGACGEPPGEVVFGVRSELAPGPSFTRLDARVSVNGVEVQSQSFEGAALDFPMELETGELEPETPVSVELVAIQGLVPILTKTGSTTVPRDRRVLLELVLESECVAVECEPGTTCKDGLCVDDFESPDTLPSYDPDWARGTSGGVCEPGGPAEVILGEGQSDFHDVDDGDVLQVEAGPQGGYHVWIAARLKNLTQSGSVTTVSGRFVDLDYEPPPSIVIFTFDPDEGDYCKIYGLRFRIDDEAHPVDSLLGESLELTVSITDQNDETASSTRVVRLSDDFI
ncbi:MAG: hypothetical protein IPM79_17975 [Polyangiaceae bacterium]|jgi:hypothetical protein|nr:hypothetical protein [Polyangiaceae bacterium]MBK8939456.1 hypothetical protein [Polyangiaceae bacterium]